jgi:hypothetical protein
VLSCFHVRTFITVITCNCGSRRPRRSIPYGLPSSIPINIGRGSGTDTRGLRLPVREAGPPTDILNIYVKNGYHILVSSINVSTAGHSHYGLSEHLTCLLPWSEWQFARSLSWRLRSWIAYKALGHRHKLPDRVVLLTREPPALSHGRVLHVVSRMR